MNDFNPISQGGSTSGSSASYNPNPNYSLINNRVEKYSDKIGTGDDAKSSVVWFVITFTLTMYACLISALVIVDIFNNKGVNILNNIKESWAIFTPIITLSLGYMFGRVEASHAANKESVKPINKD